MFGDLRALIESGLLWQQGIYSSLYPLPFVIVWSVLAHLPFPVLVALTGILAIVVLVTLFKRRALLWILYMPVLESLMLGQLSLMWLWFLTQATPLTLALLTLKPHLFPLAIPAFVERPTLLKPFLAWCMVIYVPAFVVRPAWPVEWLAQMFGDQRVVHGTSASLWAISWLIPIVAVALWMIRRLNLKTVCTSFNPAVRPYDYTMLAGGSTWLVPASWLLWATMWAISAAWPMAGLGIVYALTIRGNDKESISVRLWRLVRSPQAN